MTIAKSLQSNDLDIKFLVRKGLVAPTAQVSKSRPGAPAYVVEPASLNSRSFDCALRAPPRMTNTFWLDFESLLLPLKPKEGLHGAGLAVQAIAASRRVPGLKIENWGTRPVG